MSAHTSLHNLAYQRSVISLIQGIGIYCLLYRFNCPELLLIMSFVPLVIVQSLGNLRYRTLCIWALALTLILGLLAYYDSWRQAVVPNTDFSFSSDLIVICIAGIFISQSLVWAADIDKKWQANYPTYFDVAWKLILQLLLSFIFLGIAWALLETSSALLNFVAVPLDKVINQKWFIWPFNTFVFAMGLHLTDVNPKILRGLRSIFLTLFSALLPITVLVVSIFLLGVLISLLTHSGKTISGIILECIFGFLILEINATYQDGKNAALHNTLKQKFVTFAAKFLLLPIAIIIIVLLTRLIAHDGLSVFYVQQIALVFILTLYAVGYSIAAFCSGLWLKGLEWWNFIGALMIVAVMLALCSPLADPARIAIHYQIKRYEAGQTDALNSEHLRDGMRWGVDATQKYHLTIATDYVASSLEDKKKRLVIHTSTIPFPQSFYQQDWNTMRNISCLRKTRSATLICDAWAIKMNNESAVNIILYSQYVFYLLQQINNQWNVIGTWTIPPVCNKLEQLAKKGQFNFVNSQIPNLELGGKQISFLLSNTSCPQ